ncbi:hypothetical protein AB1K70_05325 [Bremerella sp. JC770]|uniref:hypothetical protein n=1 Tax=Bremerella sp. JC770 TaxID=3232137 RepID=UPI00345990BE
MLRISLCLVLLCLGSFAVGCAEENGVKTVPVTGTITVNGMPVRGIHVKFAPESGDRPSVANTDESGTYRAQFLKDQYGVVPGPCQVKLLYAVGEAGTNYLPKEYSDSSGKHPELSIVIPEDGYVFDYDIDYNGKLPPQN